MDRRLIDLTEDELIRIFNYQLEEKLKDTLKTLKISVPQKEDKDLMTQDECAVYLDKTKRTIQNWTRDGIIPSLSLDGSNCIFYSKKEIHEAMIKNRDKYSINKFQGLQK